MKGLGRDLTSFLFKLLHCLLPTQDRIARFGASDDLLPGVCHHCRTDNEDPVHALLFCPQSREAGHTLLGWVQKLVPNLSPEEAVKLQLGEDIAELEELPVVFMMATGLQYIWGSRVNKKQVTTHQMRSEMEAKISILRKSRYREAGLKILEMLEN